MGIKLNFASIVHPADKRASRKSQQDNMQWNKEATVSVARESQTRLGI
jgi:hypothetical protein